MNIYTRSVPKELNKYTKPAIKMFGRKVMHARTVDRIESVTVRYLPKEMFANNEEGVCEVVCYDFNYRPDAFEIKINAGEIKSDPTKYVSTLMHEMTHVWQFATNRLSTVYRNHVPRQKFNGRIYNEQKIDYWLHPWEIEANGYEIGMSALFWQHELDKNDMKAKRKPRT